MANELFGIAGESFLKPGQAARCSLHVHQIVGDFVGEVFIGVVKQALIVGARRVEPGQHLVLRCGDGIDIGAGLLQQRQGIGVAGGDIFDLAQRIARNRQCAVYG